MKSDKLPGCVWAVVALPIVLLAGCPNTAERPACSEVELAKIEAAFVTEASVTCAGKEWNECPEQERIRAKYRALRKTWEDCR